MYVFDCQQNALSKIMLAQPTFPPSGGFILDILTLADAIVGSLACNASKMRAATFSKRCDFIDICSLTTS